MLDQHSNGSATNPPVPEPIATETRNDAANTTNDLYTTKKLCLKGLHFKKRPQPEETTEERPVKRIKINAEEPQVISNDGGISNGSNAIQSQPGDIPARTPKKRGRPPRAKGEETPNGEQEDTLAKKPKAPKVKADDDALNGEKDPPAKKPKTPKVKSDVPSVNGEKDPPTKKPKASKVKAEALSGEIDTPTKKQRASKLQVGNPEMGTVKETLTKKEKVAKTKELAKLEPKWTVIAPPSGSTGQAQVACENWNLVQTAHRPRVWMSNREEFLSVLPEMSGTKCFNGVSWELYETPILMFDEVNTAFRVVCKNGDPRSIDLVTTRKFVSPLPRKHPEAHTKENVPAPVQPQIQELVPDPKAAEYLAKMEPTLHRISSTEPEIPAPFETSHPTQSAPQRNEPLAQIDEMASVPETPFTATRTNFAAPLPLYNAFNSKYDSVDSFFPSSTLVQTSTAWEPKRTLPLGLPIAKVVVQQISEINVNPPANICSEPAPQRTNTSVLFPFLPASVLAGPTENSTAELIAQAAANVEETDKDHSKKKKKKKTPGIPRRTSTRLKNLTGSVVQCDAKPEVQCSSVDGNASVSASNEDVILLVPVNASRPSEIPAQSHLEGHGTSTGSLEQPSVTITALPIFKEQDSISNAKETRATIVPTGEGTIESVVKSETPTEVPSQPNGHQVVEPNVPPAEATRPHNDLEFIPSPLPKEIQTMIDAYLFGKPLTLIASREHLNQHWSLVLPEEFGYVMMGYFKIIGVQEMRVEEKNAPSLPVGLQSTTGHVNWSFHLQWRPGGEEYIMPNVDPQVLERPWWEPPPERDRTKPTSSPITKIEQQEEPLSTNPELEAEFPTTPRYLQARLAHPEYQYRHDHFRELYECLLPSFLLAPFGALMLDGMFARGWYCQECGKVNYQSTLRHRRCSSPFCKEKKPNIDPYALPLIEMRDPQDRLPISFPFNVVPESVFTYVKTYKSGIKAISYSLKEEGEVLVNHIFTGNVPSLQETATTLLENIQLDVELKRPFNDNTPYFSYLAKRPKGKKDQPIDTPWENVPACLNDAKAHLADRVGNYTDVEKSRVSITQLKLLAWVASGSRIGTETLRATKKCIILLSLGCDIVLTLTPRFVGRSSEKNPANESKTNDETANTDTSGIVIGKQETIKAPKARALKKSEKLSLVIYLVHGDCVVLDGDDFEYSMKRDGTSFLLIASHHEK